MTFELALQYGQLRMRQKGYRHYHWQPASYVLQPMASLEIAAPNEYFFFYYPCPCNEIHFLTDAEFCEVVVQNTLRSIGKAQATFHAVNHFFASDFTELGLSITAETVLGYTFSIQLAGGTVALALATPTLPGYFALTGATGFEGDFSQAIGRNLAPGDDNPIPAFSGGVFTWPEGSVPMENRILRADPQNTKPLGDVRLESDHNVAVLTRLGMDNPEFTGTIRLANHTLKTQELFFLRFTPICK
ncbi:MAG: hypothetical protein KF690_11050 [Bacteroidetes bacterium]|nr:hypothetical protein [Bacteroidota bacterium]